MESKRAIIKLTKITRAVKSFLDHEMSIKRDGLYYLRKKNLNFYIIQRSVHHSDWTNCLLYRKLKQTVFVFFKQFSTSI